VIGGDVDLYDSYLRACISTRILLDMNNVTNQYESSKSETGRAIMAAHHAVTSGRTKDATLVDALTKLDAVLASYEDNAENDSALMAAETAAETAWEAVIAKELAR